MTRTCNRCGKVAKASPSSLPDGKYRCQPCRREEPQGRDDASRAGLRNGRYGREAVCARCAEPFISLHGGTGWTKYCGMECARRARTRSVSEDWSDKRRKKRRDSLAPGLTATARNRLLRGWIESGVACAYCPNPADTIDHIMPVVRGGTNHEGNLTPCCRACNSSKCDLTVTEWRYGKPRARTVTPRPWMAEEWVPEARAPRPTPELTLVLDAECRVCGTTFAPVRESHATCGPSCSYEYAKRCARNAYRRKVGKAEDWTTPVKRRSAA